MIAPVVGGVLMSLLGRLGWDYGKISGGGWRMFSNHTRFEVEDGYKIRFWHDLWCGDKALKEAFSNLYSIACVKDASHQWNVIFIRAARDWKVVVFALFFNLLYSFRVKQGGVDKICRAPCKRRLFDVRSFYNVIVRNDGTPFPWKNIWRIKALLRAAFFLCLIGLKGKCLSFY
jgi:hypothetical protein